MESDSLECCGNCLKYLSSSRQCFLNGKTIKSSCICNSWEWDTFDYYDRLQEAQEYL